MSTSLELLCGELERLFSTEEMKVLCSRYFEIDAEAEGFTDGSKSVFARKLASFCKRNDAIEALVDAIVAEKKSSVDSRLFHIYGERFAARPLPARTDVGGYLVEKRLLRKGLSTLYAVKRPGDEGKGYHLMVLNPEFAITPESRQRFQVLARILKSTGNPHIPQIQTVGTLDDGRPFIIYEAITMRSAADWDLMTVPEALKVLEAILDVLEPLHERSVVHGSLGPHNILLDEVHSEDNPRAAIIGFGADRLLGFAGHLLGFAPEQIRGELPKPASDIYALGCFLYEAVSGKPPFPGKSTMDIAAAHLSAEVPRLADAVDDPRAEALDSLVQTMMAKEPAHRPADLDVLRQKVEAAHRAVEEIEVRTSKMGTREDIALAIATFTEYPMADESLDQLIDAAKEFNAWQVTVEVMEEVATSLSDPYQSRKILLAAADCSSRYQKNHDKALSIYEYFLSSNPDDADVEECIFAVLEASGRYEALVERLVAKTETIADNTGKIPFYRRIAEIQDKKLKNRDNAFGYYRACLSAEEGDDELMNRLDTLAERTGRYEELAVGMAEVAQAAEAADKTDMAVSLYERLGGYYLNQLSQPAYALTCFQKVLEFRPNSIDALKAIADLYRSAQQWSELAQVTMHLGEVENQPTLRRNYMVDAAKLLYERVGNTDQAYMLVDSVLTEDPGNQGAIELMAKFLEATGDWARLAKILSDCLEVVSDEAEQLATRCRLGSIYEDHLGDLKAAREQYERALKVDNGHLDALKGLERIYAREGDNAALRDNLEKQLKSAITPKQKVELLQRLADISEEEFKAIDKAIDYLVQILEYDDSHRYALVTLTRLYRREGRWEELAEILERRAKNSPENEKKELLKERASVIRDKLKDPERAIEALTEVTSLGVDDALETLAATQEESGDYNAAISTIKKIIAAAGDTETKQSLMLKIARLEFEKLDDVDSAIVTLRKARDMNPDNRGVLSMLGRTMEAKHNFAEALRMLELEAGLEQGAGAKAEIYAKMGTICTKHLDDDTRAAEFFGAALSFDEGNFTAAYHMLKLYKKAGESENALPLYKRWADAADTLEKHQQLELLSDMGDAYMKAGRTEDAFKAYSRAINVQGVVPEPEVMLRYGDCALERSQYALVRARVGQYLQSAGTSLEPAVQEPLLLMLARACLADNDPTDANKYLRQVMATSPTNLDARVLLADVQEARGDFRQMVDSLLEVAGSMSKESPDRVGHLRRAAVVLFEKLRDSDGAIKLLKEALEIDPGDRASLAELLKIYTANKNFNELVGVVLRIADLVDDPIQKGRYYLSAAKVYRREIKNIEKAISYFEKVLEVDPTAADANKAIVETLEENKAWDKLQVHYKKMISRLPKEATNEQRLAIFVPMFELLRDRLYNRADAIMIAEVIAQLDPDNIKWSEQLAELYGWEVEYAKKAVNVHRKLLDSNPGRAESLRQLYRIFSAEGDPDKTWCAASLLSLINACTPEEHKYYKDYKPADLLTFVNVLDGDHWKRRLIPKGMDTTVTSIFAIIQPAILRLRGQDLARYGLNLGQSVDVSQSQYPAAAFVNFAAGTLGVQPPPFFFLQGVTGAFQVLETNPPVLVSDGLEESLSDRLGTVFSLGQMLASLHPGLFVSQVITSGTELLSWLLATIRMFVPSLPVPDNIAGTVSDKLAPLRSSLTDIDMERLQGHVHTFVSTSSSEVNLKKWAKCVNYTKDRAGLVLSGDIAVAVRKLREQIKDEQQLADRLRSLSLYTVSDEHFALRNHLGSGLRSA
jgi:tetratricopeptide (TPR) repeat protein